MLLSDHLLSLSLHFNHLHFVNRVLLCQVHEVLIQNQDKGSVITWDFDVMRHDVMFSVFRCKETVAPKTVTPTTLGTFNLGEPEHHSCIGRGWKEGTDYFKAEAPIVCHDGESIQVFYPLLAALSIKLSF